MVDSNVTEIHRRNQPWNEDEDERLMTSIVNGMSFEEIAKHHQRSVKSIKYRVLRNCSCKIKDGLDLDVVAKKYKIPPEAINDYMGETSSKKSSLPNDDIIKTMNLMIATLIRDVDTLSKRVNEAITKLDRLLIDK